MKLTTKPSDTCRICNIYFKIAVGDFRKKNKYISAENLFKIPERAGVASIPLADLFKAHEESHDQQRFKRFVCVVSPQRIVKKKSSGLQFAIYFKAVQRDRKLQSAASQTSADFQLSDLQADETNNKNQNIPHDFHITCQPYPLLELAVKDTSVML